MNIRDLVFTGFNGRVAALDRQSGDIVWKWAAPKGIQYVSLLLDGDRLVVSVNGYMYGLNPLTGELLWHNDMPGFGMGVASLVSINGVSSNASVPGAAAAHAAQAAAASSAAVVH